MANAVKIELIKRIENGTVKESHTVEPMQVYQFTDTLAIVAEIFEILEDRPELKEMLAEFFLGQNEFDASEYEGYSASELQGLKNKWEAEKAQRYFYAGMDSIRILLIKLPDQGVRLVAKMSDVDHEVLRTQDPDVLFGLLDAVIEVNDMEKLIERGKQSLKLIQGAFKFMKKKKVKEEKEKAEQQ